MASYKISFRRSVERDFKMAFEWFSKAANQGHAKAQLNLAMMFENGEGTNRDLKKALEWYEKSAAQGDEMAMQRLEQLRKNNVAVPAK